MKNNMPLMIAHLRKTFDSPVAGAEVGVYEGGTTNMLLNAFPGLYMYAVDPWENGEALNTTLIRKGEKFLQEVHKKFMLDTAWARSRLSVFPVKSAEGCKRLEDGQLDFVLIDGDHRYEAAKDDLNCWWEKIRSGGVCIVHDYRPAPRFGVLRAVDEFCIERKLEKVMLDPIIVAIHKPEAI